MSYRGIPNWPPTWTYGFGSRSKILRGEIGKLRQVLLRPETPNRCFLGIEFEDEIYTGCLLFDDRTFCRQIARLLESYLRRSIEEIGDLEIGFTL